MTGPSGSGKSSLINQLRGFTPKDRGNPLYAAVGVTETTTEIQSYAFPSNPNLQVYDLPGAGEQKFPIKEYPDRMKFGNYDAFVLITKDRFTENDKRLAMMIQTTYNKPFFFCRSKMDATMKEAADDQGADFDAEATEKEVRDNCAAELDDRAKEVYLLARVDRKKLKVDTKEEDPDNEGEFIKRKVEVLFPDNKKLKEDIINSLDDLQKTALCKYTIYSVDLMNKIAIFSVQCNPCVKEADRDEGRGTQCTHQGDCGCVSPWRCCARPWSFICS